MNCPSCKSSDVCYIVYGYIPEVDQEMRQEIQQNKLSLGGCIVGPDSPQYRCNECNYSWGNVDD
jgi:hypothetical protein